MNYLRPEAATEVVVHRVTGDFGYDRMIKTTMYAAIFRHVSQTSLFVIRAVFPAIAQQGTVQVVVTDASGAAVPTAKIAVRT